MNTSTVDAYVYSKMLAAGAANLKAHAAEINDLNVFPIPDGDTGDNMLMTISGAADEDPSESAELGSYSRQVADAMLLSARGNSGVILSRFFDGIADGLSGLRDAGTASLSEAFSAGVKSAYGAVLEPTEGTILTVAREASEYVGQKCFDSAEELLDAFLESAEHSLLLTPELLPVLKKAGVVDSGGAGLIRIFEGMRASLDGDFEVENEYTSKTKKLNFGKFDENSVLEYGYCTELLLRLQNVKTDIEKFDIKNITDFLEGIGNSVVAFKNGSIVKIHVHTMTPGKVLDFCQKYGEFLTVKIENMSLQHSNLDSSVQKNTKKNEERKKYGVIAAASGSGVKNMFSELGADEIVDGGQSMNPSAADFIAALGRVNAETVFILPNNGNVILTARQAAEMYDSCDVRVIESRSIGEGHAALTMMNTELESADEVEDEMREAMRNVTTAAISTCSRNTSDGKHLLYKGEYIGFIGDNILSADNDRTDTAKRLIDGIDFGTREICIMICGRDSDEKEADEIKNYIKKTHPLCEIYVTDGGQNIYSYIFIIE